MFNLNFRRVIIGFWAVWWLIAFLTDFLAGIKRLGWLSYDWITDVNYPFLLKSLALYHTPEWLVVIFFIGIIVWLLVVTVLFTRAFFSKDIMRYGKQAFIVSLYLWLAFFISDQAIMNFDLLENHMVQGGFELLTFLAFYILPE